jgi:hypothetical protein
MIGLVYRLYGERIKRLLSDGYFKPQTLADLRFAYTGPDGHAYYSWDDISLLPACRIKRIEGMLLWADAGLDSTRLRDITGMLDVALMGVLKCKNDDQRSKAIARATRLNGELTSRTNDVIPEDIYYEMAALTICREGEDPTTIDPDIHNQKREMLRQAGRAGASFFVSMPAFRSVLRASLTTEEGLSELLLSWYQDRRTWEAKRQVYTSGNGSPSTERSSTTSPSASPGETEVSSQA